MTPIAAAIAVGLLIAEDRAAADRRRADDWRRLHRRPDAAPDEPQVARASRWAGIASLFRRPWRIPADG